MVEIETQFYRLTERELEDQANVIKDVVLLALKDDKVITQEQQEHLSKSLCMIRKDISKLSYIYRMLIGKQEDNPRWIASRIYHDYEPELKEGHAED